MPLLQLLHRTASSPLFWQPVSWKICLHWRRHSPRLAIPRGCEVYCVCERVVARARHVCWGGWHRPRWLWGREVPRAYDRRHSSSSTSTRTAECDGHAYKGLSQRLTQTRSNTVCMVTYQVARHPEKELRKSHTHITLSTALFFVAHSLNLANECLTRSP